MKMFFSFCVLLLLAACFNTGSTNHTTEQLNQRITHLEQRVDSLINSRNANSIESNNITGLNAASGTLLDAGRCQAITKKGAQCKRKAKNNGYCWQHGR